MQRTAPLVLALLLAAAAVGVARAVTPGANGLLVYSEATPKGQYHVYSIRPDGTGRRQLTRSISADVLPAWSPDGKEIAFMRGPYSGDRYVLFEMHANGTLQTQLDSPLAAWDIWSAKDGVVSAPTWSPDGKSIAFVDDHHGTRLIVLGPDRRLHYLAPADERAFDPAWSPGGKSIAFASTTDGRGDIYVALLDGTGVERITQDQASAESPSWSPDGKRIVFDRLVGENRDVFVVDADGTHERRLTTSKATDYDPAWSPDGKRIAFVSNRQHNRYQVYTMAADGTDVRRVTDTKGGVFGVDWQSVSAPNA